MAYECGRSDCTVAETGVCLLNNEPATCPELITTDGGDALGEARKAQFPSSRAYTPSAARELMAERYVHLVGILGEPDAGKTGCLVSLYLSVAQGKLEGFRFADSRTLMGFEEVSQGARRWNDGQIPEQLTDHTVLRDDRMAGFLHIRLVQSEGGRTVDLLCSDLPGEWTTDLIERDRVDRMGFLERADVIWLVVDGSDAAKPERRQVCIRRTKTLIERLRGFLAGRRRLILVFTRRDRQAADEKAVDELCKEARRRDFEVEAIEVASFSDGGQAAAGYGIAKLIERTIAVGEGVGPMWQREGVETTFEAPIVGLVSRRGV